MRKICSLVAALIILQLTAVAQTPEKDKARAAKNGILSETVMGYHYEEDGVPSKIGVKKYYRKFDKRGNVSTEIVYDKNSAVVMRSQYRYNKSGRKTYVFVYDKTDQLLDKYGYKYDSKGNVLSRSGEKDGKKYEILYTYDNKGNNLKKTKTTDGTTVFTYSNTFDTNGNKLIELYEADFTLTTRMKYDSVGQLIEKQAFDGSRPGYKYQYGYDSLGRKELELKIGARDIVEESFYYTYKGDDIKTIEKYNQIGNLAFKWSYRYDGSGNVQEIKILESDKKTPTYLTKYLYKTYPKKP